MNYNLTYEQIDKLLKPYWDTKFKDSELGEIENLDGDDEDWSGIIKDDLLLVGHPSLDDGHMWFSHGGYFDGGCDMFNISPYDFNHSMLRYIEKRFGIQGIFSIV